MKHMKLKRLVGIGLTITGLAFSAEGLAVEGCFDDSEEGDTSSFVTPYGGADLSCPSTDNASYQDCTATIKNGQITTSPGCDASALSITFSIDPADGGLEWLSTAEDFGKRIDAALTDSAQGGKGCLYSFGTDRAAGKIGYQRSSGVFFPPTKAVLCSDGAAEVTASIDPPAVVEECVIDSGQSKLIHGVTFSCPEVPDGETRTIVVAKDTETVLDEFGNPVIVDGEILLKPVPDFGFTTDGNIDFNNICQCIGTATPGAPPSPTTLPLKTECDPDPEDPTCVIGEDARVPVEALFQNPKCFTIGGKRKCF
jgi:hypothetical protein